MDFQDYRIIQQTAYNQLSLVLFNYFIKIIVNLQIQKLTQHYKTNKLIYILIKSGHNNDNTIVKRLYAL